MDINQDTVPVVKTYHFYYFPRLYSKDLVAVFSDRHFNLGFNDNPDPETNRKKFSSESGIDCRDLVCTKQPHNSQVKRATKADRGKGALSYKDALGDYDALICNERNLALAIFTADCLPIFIFDPQNRAIGLVHAGWRGTRDKIVANTIDKMIKEFRTDLESLIVGFGPAICKDCYEVSAEFNDYFNKGLIKRNKKYYLDLIGANRMQLLDFGVRAGNIIESNLCTSCKNSEFFSYRKEGGSCGRMMSVIMLR